MTTVKPAVAAKVKAAVNKVLAEQYGPQTVFDPIVVVPRDDGDGEVYLHVYMVFDEDAIVIDTHKDIKFLGLLADELGENMSPEVLTHSFIPTYEWPQLVGSGYVDPL